MRYDLAWETLKKGVIERICVIEDDIKEFEENGNEEFLNNARIALKHLSYIEDDFYMLEEVFKEDE